ncbi:nuclear transport factor 2 family protein [Amycolatopsis rhabdoformis]|uniref:Nuclear transport factor 2 family protein n=1 Tax=Amycolatopsis rhabdoformis TaxID=1448059 RepID=A0ABZ1I601_9PSEU|nr:nuclear transport factor 2 family protein [Amycolatopsis rhabdoformis]WSE29851.1 nuclear transport factor 2 family protein [Amycolatopsis rhabdoformis]
MTDFQAIADRVEIGALCAEFTDAGMMRDFDRLASLFAEDGVLRIGDAGIEFASRAEIRTGIERARQFWQYFLQTAHPGVIELDGDTATGRTYIVEFGRLRDGSSHLNHSVYHDRFRRTADGWKFTRRSYEMHYVDSTPLTGKPSPALGEVLPDAVSPGEFSLGAVSE